MYVTKPLSVALEPDAIQLPGQRGAVAWGQFNRSYERLQTRDWWRINEERSYALPTRALRYVVSWFLHRTDALKGLSMKARVFASLPLPRDPDIVFFGAEVGWEALLLQALFGAGGRVVLVDADERAFERYRNAPGELQVGELTLRRDPDRIEYQRADFFEWGEPGAFDVGLDWGLIEHFPGERKQAVLQRFARNLKPGGLQVSAVPRDTPGMRGFYRLFADELNFGYRELLTPRELRGALKAAGLEVVGAKATFDTCIAWSRPS